MFVFFWKEVLVEVVAVFKVYLSVLADKVIYDPFVPKNNLKSSAVRQVEVPCHRSLALFLCHR